MRAALAYASAFGVVATCVASRPAAQRDAWLAYLSTNLTNLADHPVRALVGSAFVTDDPNLLVPKRLGLGWTINFGHRRAWQAVFGLLAFIALSIVIGTVAGHQGR